MATLKTKLLLRNDTTANWLNNSSVILSKGEVGIEWTTDGSPKIKIGNGFSTWAELSYFGGTFAVEGEGNTIIDASYNIETGALTLTKGNRLIGSDLTADTILLGNGDYNVKTSNKTIVSTLGADDTTIPTSKAVQDAIDDLNTGVASIVVNDDDIVVGTVDSASGNITIDLQHATKGPNTTGDTTKGATADVTINENNLTGSIKIPKVTVDKYGHAIGLTEQTLDITIPAVPELVIEDKAVTDTADLVYAVSNLVEDGHTITPTYTGLPTKSYVDTQIATVTNAAMVMRGTLGTAEAGATVQELPVADASTVGYAYKVITAATYASHNAKVGDVLVCYQPATDSYDWMLIPSGDDIEDTWRAIQVNGAEILGPGITTKPLNLEAGDNITLSNNEGTVTISAASHGVVDADNNGLAPSMGVVSNTFLTRVGNDANPTWNSIFVIDGGQAGTTDWGSLEAADYILEPNTYGTTVITNKPVTEEENELGTTVII